MLNELIATKTLKVYILFINFIHLLTEYWINIVNIVSKLYPNWKSDIDASLALSVVNNLRLELCLSTIFL